MIKILNDKRILFTIIVLQSLTLIAVYVAWPTQNSQITNTEVLAEVYSDPDQRFRDCLSMPVTEREQCSRLIGQELANDISLTSDQKVQNCMKLRPVFFKYCLEMLR